MAGEEDKIYVICSIDCQIKGDKFILWVKFKFKIKVFLFKQFIIKLSIYADKWVMLNINFRSQKTVNSEISTFNQNLWINPKCYIWVFEVVSWFPGLNSCKY